VILGCKSLLLAIEEYRRRPIARTFKYLFYVITELKRQESNNLHFEARCKQLLPTSLFQLKNM